MTKFIPFLISGILVVGAVGCQENASQTSSEKPADTTQSAQTPVEPASPVTDSVTETVPPATDTVEADANTNAADIEGTNDIAAKLKEALPKSNLEVQEKDDDITITGTVGSEAELKIVEQIVSQLKTTKAVKIEATVEAPKY